MKTNVSKYDFERAFIDCNRKDQFTYEGLGVLFDFLEEMEQDTGEEYELDVIALCCEFYESDWQEIADNYSIDLEDCDSDEEKQAAVIDYLNDNTMVAGETSGSIVYAAF